MQLGQASNLTEPSQAEVLGQQQNFCISTAGRAGAIGPEHRAGRPVQDSNPSQRFPPMRRMVPTLELQDKQRLRQHRRKQLRVCGPQHTAVWPVSEQPFVPGALAHIGHTLQDGTYGCENCHHEGNQINPYATATQWTLELVTWTQPCSSQ